jgi:hypothetical protein
VLFSTFWCFPSSNIAEFEFYVRCLFTLNIYDTYSVILNFAAPLDYGDISAAGFQSHQVIISVNICAVSQYYTTLVCLGLK